MAFAPGGHRQGVRLRSVQGVLYGACASRLSVMGRCPGLEVTKRRIVLWPTLAVSFLLTTGCALDDYVRQDGLWPAWFLLPFILTLVVGAVVCFLVHRVRLHNWDLRDSAGDPGGTGLLVGCLVVALALGLSFTIYSFTVDAVDPTQRLYNILWWWLGSVLGSIGGWCLGMWRAVRGFEP